MAGNLFDELKRRNVIRMAGLYLVAAWLVTQVTGTVLPMFGAPEWVARTVVLLLAVGFLPALIFAWVFELTPQGIRRDAEVAPEHSIAPQTARRMDRMIIAVLLVAITYFAFDKYVLVPRRAAAPAGEIAAAVASAGAPASALAAAAAAPPAATPLKSIAVLAFADLSPEKNQEYFSDGMAEEILNALAQVKDLKVAGRTSSFFYKGKNVDLREVGKALGVAHVLEGSVRKQGQKVRITAQLIQASDGTHLWSETYDGDLEDVFELQESIARAITDELKVVLQGEQQQRLVPVATTSPEAYALFLKATSTFDRRDGPHMLEAVQQLERAIALDPNYARAHSRLAAVHVILPTYTGGAMADARTRVRTHAQRAIALDPSLAEPWAVLGMTGSFGNADLLEQRRNFDKALVIDPDDVTTNFWYGLTLLRTGYSRAGVERIEHALAVDPMVPNVMRWRGVVYLRNGDFDGAEQFLKRAQAVGLKLAGRELAEIEARRGNREDARRLWVEGSQMLLRSLPPEAATVLPEGLFGDAAARKRAIAFLEARLAKPGNISGLVPLVLAQMGGGMQAMEVEHARVEGDNSDFMVYLFSPAGAYMRAMPEYRAYLRDEGFPELWATYGPPDIAKDNASP